MFTGVVWFGEMPHHLEEIDQIVQKADLAIVVGTSSTVRSPKEASILLLLSDHFAH